MFYRLYLHFFRHLCLLIVLINSCSSPPPDEDLPTIIIPENIDSNLYLTDLTNSVHLIQLETNEHALLGTIKDVKFFNNKYYINDGNQILVFDIKGDFLLKLGRKGDGPGEYGIIYSIAIDIDSNLIYISSVNKIIIFSADHNFIKENKYPMLLPYINIVDNNLLIISDEISGDFENGFTKSTILYKLDSNLIIKDSSIVRKVNIDENKSIGYNLKFFISNDMLGSYFYKPVLTQETIFQDTLHQLEGVQLKPYKIIDFEKPQNLHSDGYITPLMLNIFNSCSFIVCEYIQDTEKMLFLYEKNTSKYYNLKNGILDKDGIPIMIRPLDSKNNTFYYIKQAQYEKGLKQELNPIIGIVKFD